MYENHILNPSQNTTSNVRDLLLRLGCYVIRRFLCQTSHLVTDYEMPVHITKNNSIKLLFIC